MRNVFRWVWLSVLTLPVYAIAIVSAIRTGLFGNLHHGLTEAELKAVWAFLGSAIAASVTAFGLVLTHSHNERTLAFTREVEDRRQREQEETDRRLSLDTAATALGLMASNGKYAPQATIAGALATLVHLDHPVIAMRCLSAAWEQNAVDGASATWLISEAFKREDPASKVEAAFLMVAHAGKLVRGDDHLGEYFWPEALTDKWYPTAPLDARIAVALAAVKVLLSRERQWWQPSYAWIVSLYDLILREDGDPALTSSVATLQRELLRGVSGLAVSTSTGWISTNDMRSRAGSVATTAEEEIPALTERLDEITHWLDGASWEERRTDREAGDDPT